jgi:hypothetical protein
MQAAIEVLVTLSALVLGLALMFALSQYVER